MKKLALKLIVTLILISCESESTNLFELYGHTFFKVTIKDKDTLLFAPCDASLTKFIIYNNDSLFRDWGQESYMLIITSTQQKGNKTIFSTKYKYTGLPDKKDREVTFIPQDKIKKYWKINESIFIDSLYSNTISYYEQPCIECYTQDECYAWDYEKKLIKLGARHEKVPTVWRGSWQSDYRPYGFEISLSLEQDKITYNGINDLNQSYFSVRCQYKEVNNRLHLYYYYNNDELDTEFKLDTTPLLKLYRKDGNLYATDLQHFKIDSLELYEN